MRKWTLLSVWGGYCTEGKTSLGAVGEATKSGGSGTNHLGKVLPRSGSGGATIWVLNLVVDGNNYVKTRGHTCGFPAAGDGGKGVKAGGRDLAEGGGG